MQGWYMLSTLAKPIGIFLSDLRRGEHAFGGGGKGGTCMCVLQVEHDWVHGLCDPWLSTCSQGAGFYIVL